MSSAGIEADLRDPAALAPHAEHLHDVTHVVFAALHEQPGLVAGWTSPEHGEVNHSMLRHVIAPLCSSADLSHITLLQGGKAYGVHLHDVPIPARERMPATTTRTSTGSRRTT
ncbi:hypothetical protein [Aeromicrobium sp. UC242_57]|uniref:hypothetical protein n=1 Tax=Aeromicrobium sp. UC242_57 TaxID=3374624 RepID=UPI003797BD4D